MAPSPPGADGKAISGALVDWSEMNPSILGHRIGVGFTDNTGCFRFKGYRFIWGYLYDEKGGLDFWSMFPHTTNHRVTLGARPDEQHGAGLPFYLDKTEEIPAQVRERLERCVEGNVFGNDTEKIRKKLESHDALKKTGKSEGTGNMRSETLHLWP
jgi:hypothetical protein